MKFNFPISLTWLRILLIPVLVAIFYISWYWSQPLASLIFTLAGITDWADGYLARKFNQTSRFGAFLDPVADKLLVATALVILTQTYNALWMTIPAIIIIGREITISALREWMAQMGQRSKVSVAFIGKLKTATQMLALVLLLYHQPVFGWSPVMLGIVLLDIAAALTLVSMLKYLITVSRG